MCDGERSLSSRLPPRVLRSQLRVLGRQRRGLDVVRVLPRVNVLVIEPGEQLVNRKRQRGAQHRSHPEDPVVTREPAAADDVRAEGAGGVDGGAGEAGARDVGDEGREADAQGREEGGPVLLDGQEVDGQDELRRQEDLEEEALRRRGAVAQAVVDAQAAGEERLDHGRGAYRRDHLRQDDGERAEGLDHARQQESQGDLNALSLLTSHVYHPNEVDEN